MHMFRFRPDCNASNHDAGWKVLLWTERSFAAGGPQEVSGIAALRADGRAARTEPR
jgi:hypothetical protein